MEESDYLKYRGKCKEMSEAAIQTDPTLRLVRGYFYDPYEGKMAHWWTARPDGTIYDPSVCQFASKGIGGTYEEFDGYVECEECGERVSEGDATFMGNGNHAVCSDRCAIKMVGLQ